MLEALRTWSTGGEALWFAENPPESPKIGGVDCSYCCCGGLGKVHGGDCINGLSSAKLHGSLAEVNRRGVLRQPIKAEEEGASDRNVFVVR